MGALSGAFPEGAQAQGPLQWLAASPTVPHTDLSAGGEQNPPTRCRLTRQSGPPEGADPAASWADWAVQALIDEVMLSPKPGLVDRRGPGAHTDLDWRLMCRSAEALRPAFEAMARAGLQRPHARALREAIGAIGRDGERAMLQASGGVNTHRGAIWAIGLMVTAVALGPERQDAMALAARAGWLARLPDRLAPRHTGHPGERVCRSLGVGGARGQAQAGFPQVVACALPMLRRSRSRGATESAARLDALLAIMASLDDTCVLARGGLRALRRVQQGAAQVLVQGGVATTAGQRALAQLDQQLLTEQLSPGGAADLLAVTLFLDRLAREESPRQHGVDEWNN